MGNKRVSKWGGTRVLALEWPRVAKWLQPFPQSIASSRITATPTERSWVLPKLLHIILFLTSEGGAGQKVFWLLTWHRSFLVFCFFKPRSPQITLPEVKRTPDNVGPALNLWPCALTLTLGIHLPQGTNSRAAGGRAVRSWASVPGNDLKHRATLPHLPWAFRTTPTQTQYCLQNQVKQTTNRPRHGSPSQCQPSHAGSGKDPLIGVGPARGRRSLAMPRDARQDPGGGHVREPVRG